jgi:hypothetical protein
MYSISYGEYEVGTFACDNIIKYCVELEKITKSLSGK